MKLVVVKNDTKWRDKLNTGLGEENTGGVGDGRGFSSGRCSGFGNDTTDLDNKARGTGIGQGDHELIKHYEIN